MQNLMNKLKTWYEDVDTPMWQRTLFHLVSLAAIGAAMIGVGAGVGSFFPEDSYLQLIAWGAMALTGAGLFGFVARGLSNR